MRLTEDGYPKHDSNYIATRHPGEQPDIWQRTPRWVFWRTKWYRRIYTGADNGGWEMQYATDEQLARLTLENTFGP